MTDYSELIERIIRDVAELPDRTSPPDWPDAMLVTCDELRSIIEPQLAEALTALQKAYDGLLLTRTDDVNDITLLTMDRDNWKDRAEKAEAELDAAQDVLRKLFYRHPKRPALEPDEYVMIREVLDQPEQEKRG